MMCQTCNKFFHINKLKNCFNDFHLANFNAGQNVYDEVSDTDDDLELEEMLAMDIQAMDGANVEEDGEFSRLANQDVENDDN